MELSTKCKKRFTSLCDILASNFVFLVIVMTIKILKPIPSSEVTFSQLLSPAYLFVSSTILSIRMSVKYSFDIYRITYECLYLYRWM